ncbi:MAG: TAXI family TRAP transporter solute-binding subunit [Ferrovibrionaceae bacterium]
MRRHIAAAVAALTLGAAALPAQAQDFINVLTGGTSGVYYPLGVALSNIYGKALPQSKVTVQATKASVENLNLLQQGKGEIAFSLGDSLSDAWNGVEDAGFKAKLTKLRVIAPIYPNYIQVVASASSGVKSIADLKGKRVSVGAPKSGTELNARAIFKAAGLTYGDFAKVEYLPFGESVELMKNRQLDATLQSAGLGVASIRDLATTVDIVVVAVPAETVAKVGDAAYVAATIPAGTYKGQDQAVPTAAIGNYLVSHQGVSEATAYTMTKALFEGLPDLIAAHTAAKAIDIANAAGNPPVPLHPGAEKYYKERGIRK